MKLLLMAGHGAGDPGAVSGKWTEATETRKVTAALADALKDYCEVAQYPTTRNAYTDYKNGVLGSTVNFSAYDAVLEIHFNAVSQSGADGKTKGVECYVPTTESRVSLASDLCSAVAKAGLTNRGVKFCNWAVISAARRAGTLAMLLEICFIDDPDDMAVYSGKFQAIIDGIAAAIIREYGLQKEEPMTYEEFTAMLRRCEAERAAQSADEWSRPAREWAEENRLINDGRYKSHVTREELAQVLYNLLATE